MAIQRSKNLTDKYIEEVVAILDGWKGRLTWSLLIDAIELRLHQKYTRQALFKHVRIRDAYTQRKRALQDNSDEDSTVDVSPEIQALMQRLVRLEAENARIKNENNNLLQQFAIWAYNASFKGLDESFLSNPLPFMSRGQTDPEMIKKG